MTHPASDDPYLIRITRADTPQPSGYWSGAKHTQPMTHVRLDLPAEHIRRIDRAAASISVNRVDVIRAIIRQAIEVQGESVIVTKWGRSHTI